MCLEEVDESGNPGASISKVVRNSAGDPCGDVSGLKKTFLTVAEPSKIGPVVFIESQSSVQSEIEVSVAVGRRSEVEKGKSKVV